MRPRSGRASTIVFAITLTLAVSSCFASSGQDRPERFEFIPVPAADAEAEQLVEQSFRANRDERFVPGSVLALGKLPSSDGNVVFMRFSTISGMTGPMDCVGRMGPGGGGWGCHSAGEPPPPPETIEWGGGGSGEGWTDAEFRVPDNVAYIIATAEDGVTYRLEPMGDMAWMEWKSNHGDLIVRAFDDTDTEIGSIIVDSS